MCKLEVGVVSGRAESRRGRVKWLHQEKAYGFIELENRRDLFVHFSTWTPERLQDLRIGAEVDLSDSELPKT